MASKRFKFTDDRIAGYRLFGDTPQDTLSDAGCPNLVCIVGKSVKLFRSRFRLFGKWQTRPLGRFGDYHINEHGVEELIDVAWARRQVHLDQGEAKANIDPRQRHERKLASTMTYEAVVESYIKYKAKPQQRTWRATRRVLTVDCAPLMKLPIATITDRQIQDLLDAIAEKKSEDGRRQTRTAKGALRWLRTMFKFAYKRRFIDANVTDLCEVVHVPKVRDRVFNDAEIKATWDACDKLDPIERDYVRLIMLLAPRRGELAEAERAHVTEDLSCWITPNAATKSKATNTTRFYRTPLPPLAQEALRHRLDAVAAAKAEARERAEAEGRVYEDKGPAYLFPGPRSGSPYTTFSSLKERLVEAGAPNDFGFHAWRDTVASWLYEQNYRKEEVGLVLNHSDVGVTTLYIKSEAWNKKLEMLTRWNDHVAKLIGGMAVEPWPPYDGDIEGWFDRAMGEKGAALLRAANRQMR